MRFRPRVFGFVWSFPITSFLYGMKINYILYIYVDVRFRRIVFFFFFFLTAFPSHVSNPLKSRRFRFV